MNSDGYIEAFRRLDLHVCTNLHSVSYVMLALRIHDSGASGLFVPTWHLAQRTADVVADSISRVVPPGVRSIKICLRSAGIVSAAYLEHAMTWTAFEKVLLERVSKGVQEVAIEHRLPSAGTALLDTEIRGYFARLAGKGVLVVGESSAPQDFDWHVPRIVLR